MHPGVVRTELGRYMVTDENRWYMVRALRSLGQRLLHFLGQRTAR